MTTLRKARQVLCRYGARGDMVKAVVDGTPPDARVVVYYRDGARIQRKKLFPADTAGRRAAREWCAAFHEERKRQLEEAKAAKFAKPDATHGALWDAFAASPKWDDLREASRRNYRPRWKKWERFRGADSLASQTTLTHVDTFITESRASGAAINQIRQVLNVARVVYNWGTSREIVQRNVLATYRWARPKDADVLEPEEYSPEEFQALLVRSSPQDARTWRLHVALMLAGHHGQRARAVLHLRWTDIVDGEILWPKEFQKTGVELRHPLTWDAVAALQTARYWTKRGPTSRQNRAQRIVADALSRSEWVIPGHGRPWQPYGYQALWRALCDAEKAAKVAHRPYRALHGFRRMVAGTVADVTGDARLGMEWVGDKDLKQAKSYLKRRASRLDRAADAITTKRER